MARVITTDGKVKIGAYRFNDRKKPALCIETEHGITVYGHFNTSEGASEFMDELGRLVGASIDPEKGLE